MPSKSVKFRRFSQVLVWLGYDTKSETCLYTKNETKTEQWLYLAYNLLQIVGMVMVVHTEHRRNLTML